jgi:glycosyltransferase involved in cell wall biosynthesis
MVALEIIRQADAMTPDNIKFSIIIPCYNAKGYVGRAMDSALAQNRADFEIVAVDDGSTDTTGEILRSYASNHKGLVYYIRQENKGPAAARNAGVLASKGEYLLFLDADDQLSPDALLIFEKELSGSDIKYDFIYAGHYAVDTSGKIVRLCPKTKAIDHHRDFKRLIAGKKGVSPAHGAIIVHKQCFQNLSYPDTIRCNEDFVLFAHLFALYSGKSISRPVVYKYKRTGSLRSDKKAIVEALEKAPELLFDPSILPAEYFQLKPLYVAKRYLEKARAHFKSREFFEFRKTFHQAVGIYPGVIFKPRFLIRYFRSLTHVPFRQAQ